MFNHLLEYLKSKQRPGYKLTHGNNMITSTFADDFNIITTKSRTHQRILCNFERFARPINLILEPRKCKSLSMCTGLSKMIEIKLSECTIPSSFDSPETILGAQIAFFCKQNETFDFL